MSHTYRVPRQRSTLVAYLVFSAIWIGFTLVGSLQEPPGTLVFLPVCAVPVAFLFLVFEVTLADDGDCEFRSVVRRRRIRAQRVTAIRGDEDSIYVHHDHGKVHMLEPADFDDLVSRLLALNPAIELKGWVRLKHDAIAKARTPPQVRHANHETRESLDPRGE